MGCTDWVQSGQCNLAAGERCDTGVCIPPCQNTCTPGAAQCSNGMPQSCQMAPSGCFAWRDDTVCGSNEQCVSGKCLGQCTAGELEMCPAGQICTGFPEGRFCVSTDLDGGVGTGGGTGTGGGSGSGAIDAGTGTGAGGGGGSSSNGGSSSTQNTDTGRIGAGTAMGCNCSTLDAGALPLIAMALLSRLRRRRA
jgi:MYXO-CTERM domain-containing protein